MAFVEVLAAVLVASLGVGVGGAALVALAKRSAAAREASGAETCRKQEEDAEACRRKVSVRAWAAGDSSKRDESVACLEAQGVDPLLLAVLERFVASPSDFKCSLLSNNELQLYVKEATEQNGPKGVLASLFFGANRQQAIGYQGESTGADLHIQVGHLALRVSVVPGKGDKWATKAIARTESSLAHLAAEAAYARSVSEAVKPQVDEDA